MVQGINIYSHCFYKVFLLLIICCVAGLSKDSYAGNRSVENYRSVEPDTPYMVKEFTLKKEGLLKVFTTNGNIEILPSSSAEKVRVELYVDRGFSFWSNANSLDNFRINIFKRDYEIIASVERKKRDTGLFSGSISFSFKIYVPERMSSELQTLTGNISVEQLHGQQMAKTGSGIVRFKDVSGHIKAYTSGGNIEIDDTQGTIFAQTEGGNIRIDRSSGEFRLKTKGGRIISERVSGTMLARVGGGDIKANFMRVGSGINLQTSAGDIDVNIPEHPGYELTLRGSSVAFNQESELRGKIEPGIIKARYKDSGPPIELHTNAGHVSLNIK